MDVRFEMSMPLEEHSDDVKLLDYDISIVFTKRLEDTGETNLIRECSGNLSYLIDLFLVTEWKKLLLFPHLKCINSYDSSSRKPEGIKGVDRQDTW